MDKSACRDRRRHRWARPGSLKRRATHALGRCCRRACRWPTGRSGGCGGSRRDMPAERRRAATFDRRHYLQLAEANMAGVSLTPHRSVATEDIRDLQSGTDHASRALGRRLGPQQRETIERAHNRRGSRWWRPVCRAPSCRPWHGRARLESGEHRYSARAGGWQNCAAMCAASPA
jgi:hypothetical protein